MKVYLICNAAVAITLAVVGCYLLLHGHGRAGGIVLALVVVDFMGTSFRSGVDNG